MAGLLEWLHGVFVVIAQFVGEGMSSLELFWGSLLAAEARFQFIPVQIVRGCNFKIATVELENFKHPG